LWNPFEGFNARSQTRLKKSDGKGNEGEEEILILG
jgi:hypothetical protein